MPISNPVVNAGALYVNGMQLTWLTGTTFTVSAGQCRDSTNTADIVLTATKTVNTAVVGANGLDTGTMANNTFYSVYMIASSYSNPVAPTAVIISTNATAPLLPFGYDMIRRIGFVLTSGAAAILQFQQTGSNEAIRTMWYDVGISVLAAGVSAVYVNVPLAAAVPPQVCEVIFDFQYTPTGAGNIASIQPNTATAAGGYVVVSGPVAAVLTQVQVTCPCTVTPAIQYKNVGSLTLLVKGYRDQLL